jgi:hypothetical protein
MPRRELAGLAALASLLCAAAIAQEPAPPPVDSGDHQERRFSGMDEAVNVDLAERAGAPVRKPYLDVESLGELWNLILLSGGAVCGFVVGRYWDQIWGRRK